MSMLSNLRVTPISNAGDPRLVDIDTLPFAAALVDRSERICAANSQWLAAHPLPAAVSLNTNWHLGLNLAPEVVDTLLLGVREVVHGTRLSFEWETDNAHGVLRINAKACSTGALIIAQQNRVADPTPVSAPVRLSHKMETVGRLVGGVAHDFANLVTLIAGYCDILLGRIGDKDPLRPELDEIRKAANRGARLTTQLLGYTRGQSIDPKPLEMNTLIGEMGRMLRPIIGEYVELETAFAPDLGNVMADAGQMEQVIMNLILNARDAMPTGGRIRIETQNWELDAESAREHCMAAGPCIKLTISDTGVGISLEAVGQVFEPFFTTKDEGKGTGLGLSTVRSIVRQSGGDVWVESASGQGALFTICLPRIPSVVHEPVVRSAPTRSLSGTETVLLVEDEDGVRRLLTHVLHRRGYKVLAASSGMEALALFEEHRDEIALVLTDMVMAQMSGRQLAERLREIDSSTKVIFMSGYTDDVLVRTGALSPGMSFLQKPLRPDVLAEKVREALDSPTLPFNPR